MFVALLGLAFNGVDNDLEGEFLLPEYGITENVAIIPEILRKPMQTIMNKLGF